MENNMLKKGLVVGIIVIFICASFVSNIGGYSEDTSQVDIDIEDVCDSQENVLVTCRTFGFPGEPSQEITMSLSDAEFLYDKIKELQIEVARDPLSDKTQQLQHEIIALADKHNLLPAGLSVETLKSRLTPTLRPQHPRTASLPRLQNRASELFCNYVSTGSGTALPIIILPRLIPILLTPIPRLFVRWSTLEGMTSCGGLRSGTGFIAYGAQNGIALGFWGIGFSIFLPPVMAYGLFGYALFASVNAEEIEWWPPNNPPVISNENPPSGTWNVPVSLSELSFQIEDADGDLMNYSVTTDPDIGSGSGTNKGDEVYTIPVSGLKSSTQYRWTVEVADSEDVTMREFSFMTEELPFDPFDEGWQYRKKITIDHTQVAGDLNYFPVLVSTLDTDLRDKAQDDGDDMLFMNGPGVANKLYHEIEHYDGSTGELVTWVNIPSVSHDEDTVLYMYYGNPNCNSQQVPERIWDAHYCGVWHLDGFYDSTINENDGTNHGTNNCSGKIGLAKDFTKNDNDYIELVDLPELADSSTSKATFEAWIRPREMVSSAIINKMDNYLEPDRRSYNFHLYSNGKIAFGAWSGTWHPDGRRIIALTDLEVVTSGNWQYVVAVADLSAKNIILYYNGEEQDCTIEIVGSPPSYFYDIELNEWLGAYRSESSTWHYDGSLDEVRISKTCKSSLWIKTSYANQNNPSSFSSFGPEETGP